MKGASFKVVSKFAPAGDQPQAIDKLRGVDTVLSQQGRKEVVSDEPLTIIKEISLHLTQQDGDADLAHVTPHGYTQDLAH